MVKKDILFPDFGSTQSHRTNRKADTSSEKNCQSK